MKVFGWQPYTMRSVWWSLILQKKIRESGKEAFVLGNPSVMADLRV